MHLTTDNGMVIAKHPIASGCFDDPNAHFEYHQSEGIRHTAQLLAMIRDYEVFT